MNPALSRFVTTLSRPLVAAALMLVVAILVRRVFSTVIETDPDVGLYAVQAREWLRGGWPYVAVWDIHFLGEPALITVAFALLGQSVETMRMLGAITACASGVLLGRLVAGHTRDNAWSLATGLVYIIYTSLSLGLSPNNEVVMAPFVIGGVALTLRKARGLLQGEPLRTLDVLPPGLCFGVALWIKQVAAPEASMAFALLVGLAFWQGRLRLTALLGMVGVFGLACAGPTLLTGLAYLLRGDFAEFYFATFEALLRYRGDGRSLSLVLDSLFAAATRFAPLLALSAIAIVGSYRDWRDASASDRLLPVATLFWLLAAALGTFMPSTPYHHHLLLLLPPLTILASLGLLKAFQWSWLRGAGLRTTGAALLALLFVASIPAMAAVLRARTTSETDLMRRVAVLVKEGLEPGDTIFVVNSNPVIYLLADARIPTRYAFPGHLVDPKATTVLGAEADIEVARVLGLLPRYMIVDRRTWDSLRPVAQNMISAALAADYTQVAALADSKADLELYRRTASKPLAP